MDSWFDSSAVAIEARLCFSVLSWFAFRIGEIFSLFGLNKAGRTGEVVLALAR